MECQDRQSGGDSTTGIQAPDRCHIPSPIFESSEQVGALVEALAKAGSRISPRPKWNREIQIRMRSGGGYTHRYATLDALLENVWQPLLDNGLVLTQPVGRQDDRVVVESRLCHTSGQWYACRMAATPQGNAPQDVGAVITYLRRYTLCGLIPMAPEDDHDAAGGDRDVQAVKDRKKLAKRIRDDNGKEFDPKQPVSAHQRLRNTLTDWKGSKPSTSEVVGLARLADLKIAETGIASDEVYEELEKWASQLQRGGRGYDEILEEAKKAGQLMSRDASDVSRTAK